MDISVSHLNNRLALQLPAELPLGLVFVVGTVSNLAEPATDEFLTTNGRSRQAQFELVEGEHRLRCQLVAREAQRVRLHEGIQVRVGGHLMFDVHHADYYLLARDIEHLGGDESPLVDRPEGIRDQQALASILADIKKRSDASQIASSNVPIWVQKIAPPEVQAELGLTAETTDEADTAAAGEAQPSPPALNEELVAYLSSAMDSEDEVELDSEILAQYLPVDDRPSSGSEPIPDWIPVLTSEPGSTETPALPQEQTSAEPESPVIIDYHSPAEQRETDWLLIVLIVSFVFFFAFLLIFVFTSG
jgi:hypothetical protein